MMGQTIADMWFSPSGRSNPASCQQKKPKDWMQRVQRLSQDCLYLLKSIATILLRSWIVFPSLLLFTALRSAKTNRSLRESKRTPQKMNKIVLKRGLSTWNFPEMDGLRWTSLKTASAFKFVWLTVSMAVCIKENILLQTLYPCEPCFALKHRMWRWMFCEVWSSALRSARCVSHRENHCGGDWDFNVFHRLRCGVNLTHMASGFNNLFLALLMIISPVCFSLSLCSCPSCCSFSSAERPVPARTATWEYAVKTLTYN